jgi:RimJ/RimL family protein N-acetyltransferase
VQLDEADRVEVGYWLDAAVTGRGLATIGATALLAAAATLGDIALAEIHCHVDNAPSNAVPHRLGFELAGTNGEMQLWRRKLVVAGDMSR